jgi:serine/threonine protein kinase
MWARCLSCLIPLQSRVRAPRSIVPSDKEREDYTLVDDTFNGSNLRTYCMVNAYVVLGPVKGHTGQARLILSRADKTFFALRYVSPAATSLILRSHEEIAVLKRLSHPNIVKHYECLVDSSRGGNYLIFEHTPRGVVTSTQLLEGVAALSEPAARIVIRDLINALEYMHALRIVHADVRPDNILRAVNGAVKLNPVGCITQDFTEIRDMPGLVKARLGSASPAFLAPELCYLSSFAPRIPHKSFAMDVWSVGAMLYFLLYGRVPFGGTSDEDIHGNICVEKLKFPRVPETSRKVRNLLKGVLGEKDPKTRIPLAELKLHPWFAEGMTEEEEYLSRASANIRLVVSAEEVDAAVSQATVRMPK